MEDKKDYELEDLLYQHVYEQRPERKFRQHEDDEGLTETLRFFYGLENFPAAGARVLEVGCGDGFTTMFLARRGLRLTSIDTSLAALERARENLRAWEGQVELRHADACTFGESVEEPFDAVIDSHCLHCIVDKESRAGLMKGVLRLLKEGGTFFVATMAKSPTGIYADGGDAWEREVVKDERDCIIDTRIPPGAQRRVQTRIWISEEELRRELTDAGFSIASFALLEHEGEPKTHSFIVEARK